MVRAALALVVLGIVFIPLEKFRPVRRGQRVRRPGARTDVLHFIITGTLGTIALIALVVITAVPLQRITPDSLRRAITSQPAILQFLEALFIVEVAGYWAHRAHHEIPMLWKLHRVHHSSRQMDWLAAAHLHPLDSATTRIVAIIPLALLGFSQQTFGTAIVVLQLHAIFGHANFRVRFGPIEQLISAPHFHHWHHTGDPGARDHNFAGLFPWVDRLFGTYHAPTRAWPEWYGIDEPMPTGYLGQLQSPFVATPSVEAA